MATTTVESHPGRGRCAVAAADLPAGQALAAFSGEPYAACLLREQWPRRCAHCFQVAEEARPLLRCSRCRLARYCNRACQAAEQGPPRRDRGVTLVRADEGGARKKVLRHSH